MVWRPTYGRWDARWLRWPQESPLTQMRYGRGTLITVMIMIAINTSIAVIIIVTVNDCSCSSPSSLDRQKESMAVLFKIASSTSPPEPPSHLSHSCRVSLIASGFMNM